MAPCSHKYANHNVTKMSSYNYYVINKVRAILISFLHQLYDLRGTELCVTATKVNTLDVEYYHTKTTPNVPIRLALRMTVAIPGEACDSRLPFYSFMKPNPESDSILVMLPTKTKNSHMGSSTHMFLNGNMVIEEQRCSGERPRNSAERESYIYICMYVYMYMSSICCFIGHPILKTS